MEENKDKSAFPLDANVEWATGVDLSGLTKREYFAGLAMQSLATDVRGNAVDVCKKAIEHADELLKQLDK